MSDYAKDMSAYTYILNTIASIRLKGIAQETNEQGNKILTALLNMIETYKPVKPIEPPSGQEVLV
jgi:hypothetical protein